MSQPESIIVCKSLQKLSKVFFCPTPSGQTPSLLAISFVKTNIHWPRCVRTLEKFDGDDDDQGFLSLETRGSPRTGQLNSLTESGDGTSAGPDGDGSATPKKLPSPRDPADWLQEEPLQIMGQGAVRTECMPAIIL